MPDFKIVLVGEKIKFKKKDFNFKNDPGVPVVGWVPKKKVCFWLNHLRGSTHVYFNICERKEISPDHITLYKDEEPIGWIERKHSKEILKILWDYVKGESFFKEKYKDKYVIEDNDEAGREAKQGNQEQVENKTGQLSLFG